MIKLHAKNTRSEIRAGVNSWLEYGTVSFATQLIEIQRFLGSRESTLQAVEKALPILWKPAFAPAQAGCVIIKGQFQTKGGPCWMEC